MFLCISEKVLWSFWLSVKLLIYQAEQDLISRLDSRMLRPVNVLDLVFSTNIKNGISNIRNVKH